MASDELIKDIIRLRSQGISTDDTTIELFKAYPDVTRNVVAKVWWNYDTNGMYQEFAPLPRSEKILNLHDWVGVSVKPQLGEFNDAVAKLNRDVRYQIWEHDCDNHFPYQDDDAQALRSLCRQRLQPHGIVGGSDAADFPTISRFEPDRRIPTGRVLSRFRNDWSRHVQNRLRYDAKDALIVWEDGNHDERAWLAIEKDDNHDILTDYHAETIMQGGEVYWRGVGDDSLEVIAGNALVITHGWKSTKHTASGMLDEYDRQYSGMSGHSHKPDYYTLGTKYKVTWLIGGCGCLLNPSYDRRKKRTKWQHGYSYAIVDAFTETAIVKHVDFYHTDNSVWCALDGDILSVKKQVERSEAAA